MGFDGEQIEAVYARHGLRRTGLIDRYRMKRNTRIAGAVLLVFAMTAPFLGGGLVYSLPLIACAVALVITGSSAVYLSS